MAKKGNMNINNEDFEFDDELFPLDDSVYEDDDLAGFNFDPNAEGPTGAKGFIVNTLKSVKGIGLDFVDEFLPELSSMTDDVKMAISDTKDKFIETKDKGIEKAIDFKKSFLSTSKDSAGDIKGFVKNSFNNIKKGKFYVSNRDNPIDMDSLLNDDDDEEVEGNEEPADTSGIMTTKFNYKTPRRRRETKPVIINNDGNSQVYIEAQEASTASISSINKRLANAQIANSNSNFYESIKVLKNIDDNLYGLSKFLTHYGKTNIDAQLEFDSKTLAFLTDQRALLKEILKTNNKAIGIKEETDEEETTGTLSPFGVSGFDFSKYLDLVKNNAKNMFMGTQLGQVIDMGSGMMDMFGKDSGLKLNPADIAKNVIKSFGFNQLISSDTKTKLDRLNDMIGNAGGTIASLANRWKDSNSPIFSFLGELLGTESGLNKYYDLNKENLNDVASFDVLTKETINTTIPGYLSQILSAITGNKLSYFNHESKQFEETDSIGKKYDFIQKQAIESNFKFQEGMRDIYDRTNKENRSFTSEDLNKAFKIFQKNLIQSKSAIDTFRIQKEGGDEEYRNKMFRGFESIAGDREKLEELKDLFSNQIASLSPAQIADINTSINKVANDIETSSKEFKEHMTKIGGLTSIAEINDKERWEEADYNANYSSLYNDKLVKDDNLYEKRRAKLNLLEMKKSQFQDRVGKISLENQFNSIDSLNNNSTSRLNDIYELLLNGIKVFPTNLDEKNSKLIKEKEEAYTKYKTDKNKKQKEEEDAISNFEIESSKARIEYERYKKTVEGSLKFKGAKNDTILGNIRRLIGVDNLVNKSIDMIKKPLSVLYGEKATEDLINEGSYDKVLLEEQEKFAEESREYLNKKVEEAKINYKARKKNKKKNKKDNIFDKGITALSNLKESAQDKVQVLNAKISNAANEKDLKRSKKEEKRQKDIEKNGTYSRRLLNMVGGDEAIIKYNNATLTSSNSARIKIFVDPEWLKSFNDKSKTKNRFYNISHSNGAYLTTDPDDDDIDVAFYNKNNLDKEDIDSFKKRKIFEISATKNSEKNLDILENYISNPGVIKENLKRNTQNKIIENSEIQNYDDRDTYLTEKGTIKFDFNAKEENTLHNDYNFELNKAKTKLDKFDKTYNNFNNKYDKESEKYKELSDEKRKEIEEKRTELEEKRKKLLEKVETETKKRDKAKEKANTPKFKYKYINKINSPKDAGKLFLKPETQSEIDDLLASGDKSAIYDFAYKIKSNNEFMIDSRNRMSDVNKERLMNILDPEFRSRVSEFLSDPELLGKGVSLKETSRSPLLQFALYSKGRVDPKVTRDLLRAAGNTYSDPLEYFPKEIRNIVGPDGITVRSLASNHLTGRALDLTNGSMNWKKLSNIASYHGLKWAGEKDKPHFEFDTNYKPHAFVKGTNNDLYHNYSDKNKSIVELNNSNNINNKTNELKVSGKPISEFQNDPIDTAVSGNNIEIGKPVEIGTIANFKTNKDILLAIYSNTQRIADNTEKIGFRFGIPGKIGSGLIGKTGDTLKSLGKKLYDGTKSILNTGKDKIKSGFDIAKKGVESTGNLIKSKIKDKVFPDLEKLTKDQLIEKYNLTEKLELTSEQIKKKYTKEQIIEKIKEIKHDNSIITKGKNIITNTVNEVKDVGGNLYNKAKDFVLGKKEDAVEKAKEYLLEKKLITKTKLKKLDDKEIIKLAVTNGFKEMKTRTGGILSKSVNTVTKAFNEVRDVGGNLYNKAKDFVLGKKEDAVEKAKEYLLEKKLITKTKLKKLSEEEILKMAKENGFNEIKSRVGGLLSKAKDFGGKIVNKVTSDGLFPSVGERGIRKTSKILAKMDEIIEAIYLANGKEVPESLKVEHTATGKESTGKQKLSSIKEKISNKFSSVKQKISDKKDKINENKSRRIIQKYGFEERLKMNEDKILEIYSYDDLKKFSKAIDKGEKFERIKTPKETKLKQTSSKIKTTTGKVAAAGKQKLSSIKEKISNKFSSVKQKISDKKDKINENKSRRIIQKYNLTERFNMDEDKILEIYSYDDLKKYKTAINRKENNENFNNIKARTSSLLGKAKEKIKGVKPKISQGLATGKQKIHEGVEKLSEKNIRRYINKYKLPQLLNSTEDEIYNVFTHEEIMDYVKDQRKEKLDLMKEKLKAFLKNAVSKGVKIGKGVFNTTKKLVKGGISLGSKVVDKAKTFTSNAVKKLGETNILSSIGNRVGQIFDSGKMEFRANLLAKLDKIDADILQLQNKQNGVEIVSANVKPTNEASTNTIDKNSDEVEGSYKDQKFDKERKEERENTESMAKNIASIATVLGTPQAIAAVGKESVQPDNSIGSLLKANYENTELQNELLSDIKETSARNGNGGGGFLSNLGKGGAKLVKGINAAGAVATIGAAGAGAFMIGKQLKNNYVATKEDAKYSTLSEKIGSAFGAGGSGNYDAAGNEIDSNGKAGRNFGANQLVHIGTFAKGVSKIGSLFAKFSKLVSKLFTNPKLVAKIGGKEAAAKVSTAFIKEMSKAAAKPGILTKISTKISSFCAKATQPIGWGVILAQLLYDIGSGMSEASRYFKMGKGMKPTWAMRLTAGLAKALSGNLTFGLIPASNIANFIFKIIGKDATKIQMAEAKEFDMKRAELMEVEYDRLVEFETMPWTEIVFGGDKKRATILGFLKYDKKNKQSNKDNINRFKTWFDKVYQPLDQMYKNMVKQYGGKVDNKINPDDVAALENRDKFRKDYLESAKNYINKNKLYGLGPLAKNKNPEELSEAKLEEDQNKSAIEKEEEILERTSKESSAQLSEDNDKTNLNSSQISSSIPSVIQNTNSDVSPNTDKISVDESKKGVEREEKQMEQTSEDSSAQLSLEGLDVKGTTSTSPILTASLPKNESESSSVSAPKNKIQVNEPKETTVTNTTGVATVSEPETKNQPKILGWSSRDNTKDKLDEERTKYAEESQADGINFKKLMNKNYITQWKQFAKDNIKKSNLYNSAIAARAGIIGKFKKTKVGALMSKGFAKIKSIASNLIGGAKDKVSGAKNNIKGLIDIVKGPASAIASFVTNRKEAEGEISSLFNKNEQSPIMKFADQIADKDALGQQNTTSKLSPEFAERVEAFLKDPRVMNHGVKIREGYRSPLTQLAYYSKGRASNEITDKLMKKAGFKSGINFWAKSFQKPGDYITWTLASNHFNGTAVDLEPGDIGYDKLGKIAEDYGIDWGGNWSTPDKPHFELGNLNFKLNKNATTTSSLSDAEAAQADTFNYDKVIENVNRSKDNLSKNTTIGIKNNFSNFLNNRNTSRGISRINNSVKSTINKNKDETNVIKSKAEGILNSNLIVSKFDELLKISTEGVDIMRDLLNETVRHNKKEEEMMSNLIKGIVGIGALIAAANNGGHSSATNANSITHGLFDNLAKGL